MTARGTTNRNQRGSAESRRRRKVFLLQRDGDGTVAPCALRFDEHCTITVTIETMTVDRIKPGALGGTYKRDNIRVACMSCNSRDGTALRVSMTKAPPGERVNRRGLRTEGALSLSAER